MGEGNVVVYEQFCGDGVGVVEEGLGVGWGLVPGCVRACGRLMVFWVGDAGRRLLMDSAAWVGRDEDVEAVAVVIPEVLFRLFCGIAGCCEI